MLKAVDFDEHARTTHPTVPTCNDLQKFDIPVERHAAYELMWKGIVFSGCIANTAMWLYV
jgi:hypothetical protein